MYSNTDLIAAAYNRRMIDNRMSRQNHRWLRLANTNRNFYIQENTPSDVHPPGVLLRWLNLSNSHSFDRAKQVLAFSISIPTTTWKTFKTYIHYRSDDWEKLATYLNLHPLEQCRPHILILTVRANITVRVHPYVMWRLAWFCDPTNYIKWHISRWRFNHA